MDDGGFSVLDREGFLQKASVFPQLPVNATWLVQHMEVQVSVLSFWIPNTDHQKDENKDG